jgi:hypothetical protein
MGDLRAPNPALAQKLWDSMARPSTRRVATRLSQSGASISHQTVARWRNRGWRPLERARRERPRNGRAAEQRDERTAFHSITSSAMASKRPS